MPELQLGVESPKRSKLNTSTKVVALVGQPNSGKSTLFNTLSDIKVSTANFAGTTVEYKETLINIFNETFHLIDLPGTYSLNPFEPAEYVTVNYLLNNKVDLIINVVDSTLITRSLELTIELLELGIPFVVALNMSDETRKHGIDIDSERLSEILGVPVVKISALYGKGIQKLMDACYEQSIYGANHIKLKPLPFTHHIESWIQKLSEPAGKFLQQDSNISSRFWAIKALENPSLVDRSLLNGLSDIIKSAEIEIETNHKTSLFEAIEYERHHQSMSISHKVTQSIPRKAIPFSERLDLLFLKPSTGYIFALFFFALYFSLVFVAGNFIASLVDAPLSSFSSVYGGLKANTPFLWHTVEGLYQGVVGAFGIVLPYFLPLLLLTAILEETGYMARIAFLLDGIFHQMGLHGKSVAPFIMGFGCIVPAVYATRIIENRRDRLITSILINFIPCSARLTVIFALTTALTGPFWTAVIFAYVLFAIAGTGKLISLFMPKPLGLILEIPPLRLPSFKITLKKTYFKLKEFFKVAVPFLILGSVVLSWLEYFNFTQHINRAMQPFISNVLGLPEQLGSTLIFGFLRKELVVFMTAQAFGTTNLSLLPLTIPQVVVFLVFIIFYFPCISTTAVFWKEFGWKHLLLTIFIGLCLSTISALLFRLILGEFFNL